jgi:serine/threonine protein kinase
MPITPSDGDDHATRLVRKLAYFSIVTDARPTVPTVPGLTGLSVLARGGYATVYRAVQESIGRDVAVKVENRRLESERDQQRFLREARAAGRMSGHPNVIDLFDAGMTANGHPYLIMELGEASYAERMKTDPLSPVEARDVGVKIADALADAHALGVLHRDVKPANLLISRFGEPQLADFGLAVLVEVRDHSVMLDVLTPAYAPPEMFRYAPPSPAADVYALCATLYALMRGRPARWRDDINPSLVSTADMFGEPIPDVPGVPPELMVLLRAGMEHDEHCRPTAVQLRDALFALDFDLGGGGPVRPTRRPVFTVPTLGPREPAPAVPRAAVGGRDADEIQHGDRPAGDGGSGDGGSGDDTHAYPPAADLDGSRVEAGTGDARPTTLSGLRRWLRLPPVAG